MKPGQIWGALKDGKPIGYRVEYIYHGTTVPGYLNVLLNSLLAVPCTLVRVTRVKENTGQHYVVKYPTAEGKPRGWTLIEDVP